MTAVLVVAGFVAGFAVLFAGAAVIGTAMAELQRLDAADDVPPSDSVLAEVGAVFALADACEIVEAEARRISAERHPSSGGAG